jgi:hypothetical protein
MFPERQDTVPGTPGLDCGIDIERGNETHNSDRHLQQKHQGQVSLAYYNKGRTLVLPLDIGRSELEDNTEMSELSAERKAQSLRKTTTHKLGGLMRKRYKPWLHALDGSICLSHLQQVQSDLEDAIRNPDRRPHPGRKSRHIRPRRVIQPTPTDDTRVFHDSKTSDLGTVRPAEQSRIATFCDCMGPARKDQEGLDCHTVSVLMNPTSRAPYATELQAGTLGWHMEVPRSGKMSRSMGAWRAAKDTLVDPSELITLDDVASLFMGRFNDEMKMKGTKGETERESHLEETIAVVKDGYCSYEGQLIQPFKKLNVTYNITEASQPGTTRM